MSRDVTDIVRSEEELRLANTHLERTNKELESFNYVASHDLQEPLRKIQSFILLLEENVQDNELRKKYLDKIMVSAQRMSQLIQNVLGYSKIKKTEEEFEQTDLNQVLNNALADEELVIQEKNATIESDPLPVIKASPIQMHQLFSNLIGNSLKFCERRPIIRINASIVDRHSIPADLDTKPGESYLQLQFIDNGIGFEGRYKEQIFKLFQRLHNRNEFGGTGVGLSIVTRIVENHHGFIRADSVPGEGATFTIWLPVHSNRHE
jgi:light-regulated signal transduction histidine kinase (bacteriophytochrome)